ncbi:MAG: PEPxxWA-CTERM sorting domain-containing protein [Caulobacteraceae bacterium]
MRLTATILAMSALGILGAAGPSSAGVVLSDNFDSDAAMLNWSGDASFSSIDSPASTDLVSNGTYGITCFGGAGGCVDLDGTTGSGNNPAGVLRSNAAFAAGSYILSFELSGNQRGATAQTTSVSLGNFSHSFTLASGAPFATEDFNFATTGGNLTFTEHGPSDQQGNILDDVTLSLNSAVPEPGAWALMILGIGGVGAALRKSKMIGARAF